jgi:hypothetical protein
MNQRVHTSILCSIFLALAACSSSSEEATTPEGLDVPTGEWQTLISGDWTLPAGGETYVCVRKTIEEDLYVNGFESIAPTGTHHALLGVGVPDAPDGIFPCQATTVFGESAYGGGRGVEPLVFPDGIARKIPKGSQVLLNMHLFNSYGEDIGGTSGVRIRTIPKSEVTALTEHIVAGTEHLTIPARQTTTHSGACRMTSDVTLLAVAPHMHQLGTHLKAVAETAEGDVTLLDAPFTLDTQSYRPLEPLALRRGDRVRVECTHANSTDAAVFYGLSALDEMCTAAIYRFPADGTMWFCMDD